MKSIIGLVPLILLIGCSSTKYEKVKLVDAYDLTTTDGRYYQAYDSEWRTDPTINPIFDTRKDALDYANTYNEGNAHLYIVRVINYRYEIRNENPNANEMIYTTNDFNDGISFVDEFSGRYENLVMYDLKKQTSYE